MVKAGRTEQPASKVVEFMASKTERKPYTLFRGVSGKSGIIELSETVSRKMGLHLDSRRGTIPVLGTRTNLNDISQTDLPTLAVNNRRETLMKETRLASLLSQRVIDNYCST